MENGKPATMQLILLTGATGYVGGRLLPLLESLAAVRCLARDPATLAGRTAPETDVVAGDVTDRDSLDQALAGVETVYYLVHSMGGEGDFAERDRAAAETMADAASAAGVRRLVYLGGLGHADGPLSPHLRSRQEVGEIFRARADGVQVLEFRASIIIGAGSASFEMIRALVERLPVMVTPRWVSVMAQPIAIDDVLAYLVAALDVAPGEYRIFEIGGRDRLSYRDIMREYARQRGLHRLMIPVPALTPHLSSLWLALVTPLYARIGRSLVESLRHPTTVESDAAEREFGLTPRGARESIADAIAEAGREGRNHFVDSRTVSIDAAPDAAFAAIRRLGGDTGWYYGDWLWKVRGWMDVLAGGPGLRRGRRHPEELAQGEALDFWKVEAVAPGLLRLVAEMRLPGRAWLEFEVTPDGAGSRIRQTAIFDPVGVGGIAYWYAVKPLHELVFAGMIRGIAREAGGRGRR
jgi:uncharacterized protein YbjT (DUF2867 family)